MNKMNKKNLIREKTNQYAFVRNRTTTRLQQQQKTENIE